MSLRMDEADYDVQVKYAEYLFSESSIKIILSLRKVLLNEDSLQPLIITQTINNTENVDNIARRIINEFDLARHIFEKLVNAVSEAS